MYCATCSKEIDASESYTIKDKNGKELSVCKECKKMASRENQYPSTSSYQDRWSNSVYGKPKPIRPLGVTILAILDIIGAIVTIAFVGLFAQMYFSSLFPTGFIEILTVVVILLGLLQFVVAYGLLIGAGWAWTIELILQFFGLISLNFLAIIIRVIIIYYLFRPHVREFFGK